MKKIVVIHTHDASKEERKKLRKYLKKHCWDHKNVEDGNIKFREL